MVMPFGADRHHAWETGLIAAAGKGGDSCGVGLEGEHDQIGPSNRMNSSWRSGRGSRIGELPDRYPPRGGNLPISNTFEGRDRCILEFELRRILGKVDAFFDGANGSRYSSSRSVAAAEVPAVNRRPLHESDRERLRSTERCLLDLGNRRRFAVLFQLGTDLAFWPRNMCSKPAWDWPQTAVEHRLHGRSIVLEAASPSSSEERKL